MKSKLNTYGQSRNVSYDAFIAFMAALPLLIKITFVGNLLGTDLIALFLVAVLTFSPVRLRELLTTPKLLLLSYCAWFMGAVLTDLYRGTPEVDLVRGWSKIIFFGLTFAALYMLMFGRLTVLRWYMFGIALGWLIRTAFLPDDLVEADAWKFGYSHALAPLAALLGSSNFVKRRFGWIGESIPLGAVGLASLFLDYRSMFAICAIASLFCVLKHMIDRYPVARARLSPMIFVVLVVIGFGVTSGLTTVYKVAAQYGYLGEDAREKYDMQTEGDLNFIQSGRIESLVSTQAIADSPIIGHGSWARDMTYVTLLVARLEQSGQRPFGDPFESDLIPTHSHLLGSWVEAGIFGGLFWIAVFCFGAMSIYRVLKLYNPPTALVSFYMFTMLWDILFSPFAQEQRFLMASNICLALWVLRQPIAPGFGTRNYAREASSVKQ